MLIDFKTLTNENRKFLLDMTRRLVNQLETSCPHEFKPLTEKQLNDKWMSVFAKCLICGEFFGWRCKRKSRWSMPLFYKNSSWYKRRLFIRWYLSY